MHIGGERNEVTFGKFVLDRRAGELRKCGIRVRVPDQSIKVLSLLLERPGDVITREELCHRLWPNGTNVEFEHGVNNAIRRLRSALDDSAGESCFIETLPKHGYRFIFPCKWLPQTVAEQTGTRPDDLEDLSGKQFGPYQVLQKLGEGGTASVYRGFDPRLARFIALKFPAAHLLDRPFLRRRFENEARLASALNHPNVCTIYDVGVADGLPFIAMELLEGATLERLLRRGALPLPRVLNYARQIAIALDAAHRSEIVHRDVKPGNIFITSRHMVKVTDFGIAQRHSPASWSELNPLEVLVAGTPGYIAPEHLKGKEPGARGDIFAFGVVLHEMLMGRRPLEPEQSQPSVITALQFDSHAELSKELACLLDRILRSCLQNDPQERYGSAEDLLRDLDLAIDAFKIKPRPHNSSWGISKGRRWWELEERRPDHPAEPRAQSQFWVDPSSQGVSEGDLSHSADSIECSSALPIGTVRPGSSKLTNPGHFMQTRISALLGPAVVLAAAVAIYAIYPAKEFSEHTTPSLKVKPLTSSPGNEVQPSLSPDGNQVAFAFDEGGSSHFHIYVKVIGSEEVVRLTSASADDRSPAWSPDSQNLCFLRFVSDQEALVMVVPSSGGAERQLAKILISGVHKDMRVTWSPDGEWLATSDTETLLSSMRLVLISARTGEKRRLVYQPPTADADVNPSFSPDGRYLAFARHISIAVADIYVLELPRPGRSNIEARRLTDWNRMNTSPVWSGDGQDILFVGDEPQLGSRIWRISAFHPASPSLLSQIGEDSSSITFCPRRSRLIYAKESLDTNIWRIELGSVAAAGQRPASFSRLIASTRFDDKAQYSPDGKYIAYGSERSGDYAIWIANRDGSASRQLTHLSGKVSGHPRWSPDGKHIAFHSRPSGYANLYVVDVETGSFRQLTAGTTNDTVPSWSHDGKWIYFDSERQDGPQIWKVPTGGGEATRLTKNGGAIALESVDGKLIYYSKFTEPGLWVLPLAGGVESQILPSLYGVDTFAITKGGIYFVRHLETLQALVSFLNFSPRFTQDLARVRSPIGSGLAVSPDESSILYTQTDYTNSDLILVDNIN